MLRLTRERPSRISRRLSTIYRRGTLRRATSLLSTAAELYETSGYATWFTAGGAIRIAHYDVIDDVITRKL